MSSGDGQAGLPDKLRAMRFDSVLVLSRLQAKSPLVIGFRRVLHLDTNDETHTLDTTMLYHGQLFNMKGELLLPYTVHSIELIPMVDCKKSVMIVKTYDWLHGYPEDSIRAGQFLYDLQSDVAIDSTGLHFFRRKGGLVLWLKDNDDGLKVYDACKGYWFNPKDPFSKKVIAVWTNRGVKRVIARKDDDNFAFYDLSQRQALPFVFRSWEFSDLETFFNDEDNDPRVWVYTDVRLRLDPATGKFSPDNILDVKYGRWWMCEGYESGCIQKMRLEGIQNRHPVSRIDRALVQLTIKDGINDQVVYKQNHWVNINLNPGEVGATQEFNLNTTVYVQGDVVWSAEVLEYR